MEASKDLNLLHTLEVSTGFNLNFFIDFFLLTFEQFQAGVEGGQLKVLASSVINIWPKADINRRDFEKKVRCVMTS